MSVGYNAYAQNSMAVESPYRLIQMLFEGVLRFTAQAKIAMADDDIEKQVYWINRTIDIFAELIASLDFKNEDNLQMSEYLKGLYTYQIKLLTEANLDCDEEKIDTVINVAQGLLEAWNEDTGLASGN